MQKIFTLFILLFTLNASAQLDSLKVDSLQVQKTENYSAVVPFSAESLNNLSVISKQINTTKTDVRSYFFLFLLNLLTITVLLFSFSRAKVKKLISTLFSLNVLMQYAKVETKRDNYYLYAYFILLVMFLSAIIYVLALNIELNIDVLKITLFVLGFLIFDFLVIIFSAFIFRRIELKEMNQFNNFSFMAVLLPFFIVTVLFLLFLNEQNTIIFGTIFFIILAISYFWKETRNLLILKANRINIFSFYFFLYLCTFKILPLAIFFKITYAEFLKI